MLPTDALFKENSLGHAEQIMNERRHLGQPDGSPLAQAGPSVFFASAAGALPGWGPRLRGRQPLALRFVFNISCPLCCPENTRCWHRWSADGHAGPRLMSSPARLGEGVGGPRTGEGRLERSEVSLAKLPGAVSPLVHNHS